MNDNLFLTECGNFSKSLFLYLKHCEKGLSILNSLKKACIDFCMGNKKTFSNRIDEDRIKDLKYLSADTGKPLGVLLEEAIKLLVKSYRNDKPTEK